MASVINASTSAGLVQTADTSGVLQLQTANTTAVTVDASQNVGIGTTTTTGKLNVSKSNGGNVSGAANAAIYLDADESTIQGPGTYTQIRMGGNLVLGANSLTAFFTNNTERMRIASDGKIAMGTSTTGGWPSDAFFESRASSGWAVSAYNTSASSAGAFLARIDNTSRSLQEFYYSTTYVGKITTNGSTTTYGSASDYRLKDNVVAMTGALQKVALLKPVTYTWKNSGINDNGFIAHELAEVLPNAVNGTKDAVDDNGNPVYQTVDTSFLVATLTAAIQEQQTIINDLKARVTALEAK
jgi:hypothetical protein